MVFTVTDRLSFIESVFGKGHLSGNGKNFDVKCPICDPKDATKKKLSIRTSDDACHCWVCGFKSRTLAPLIRKYGSISQFEKYRQIFGGIDNANNFITGEETKEEVKLELPRDFKLLTLAYDQDPDVKAAWRYLHSRKIDENDVWYFKLGVSSDSRWKRRIVMPSFDGNGKLNYFTARSIDKGKRPKYDNPDVDKNPVVFNEINVDWTSRLVLCEGPFDLIKCTQNATAMLGSDLDERHEIFNKILLNNTPVALALDGDMWLTKTPKIAKKLSEYNIDVLIVDVRPWGDPGNMSRAEFEIALSEAKPPSWQTNFLDRLSKASTCNIRL